MITTCNPKGYFSTVVFQSKDTFSRCFFLLSVNNSLAPDLHPHPQPRQLSPGCLVSAEQRSSAAAAFQESNTKALPPPWDSFPPDSSKETS